MKIVCLIGTPVYLNYFINELAAQHEIALVVREDSHARLFQKIKKKGLVKSFGLLLRRLKNKAGLTKDYKDILGDRWQQPDATIPLINVAGINDALVRQQLEKIKPDLVLVHGTSMIAGSTLAGIPLVLNLHWGLSPYYKGSYCTEWALLNGDPLNIGYTIHRVSAQIDAGEVLTQGRLNITPTDTANRINMKLTKAGTGKIIEVVRQLKQGRQFIFAPQDKSKGTLYLTKHYTAVQQAAAAKLDHPAAIEKLLSHPSRPALPIIETV